MEIHRSGPGPAVAAPEIDFTGDVRVAGYGRGEAPSWLIGAAVTFSPSSRTPWKVNSLGQTLVLTGGVGWAPCEGEGIVEIHAGDTVWCPPARRHWEGATPDGGMTYVALHEQTVQFEDPVSDAEYPAGPG